MKKLLMTAIAASGFGLAATAQAQDSYSEDSGAYVNVGVDTFDFDAYGVGGKVGYDFNQYFGVEGQGSVGVKDDEVTVAGNDIDVGYDYFAGGFGVAKLPVSEQFSILGRAGYYAADVSAESAGIEVEDSIDGFAAGGGVQYMMNDLNGIRAEYTYLDADDGDADTYSISYVRKF